MSGVGADRVEEIGLDDACGNEVGADSPVAHLDSEHLGQLGQSALRLYEGDASRLGRRCWHRNRYRRWHPPPRLMTWNASRAQKNEPRALTAITASQSRRWFSVMGLFKVRPALFTRTSSPPEGTQGRLHRAGGGLFSRDVAVHREYAGKPVRESRMSGRRSTATMRRRGRGEGPRSLPTRAAPVTRAVFPANSADSDARRRGCRCHGVSLEKVSVRAGAGAGCLKPCSA